MWISTTGPNSNLCLLWSSALPLSLVQVPLGCNMGLQGGHQDSYRDTQLLHLYQPSTIRSHQETGQTTTGIILEGKTAHSCKSQFLLLFLFFITYFFAVFDDNPVVDLTEMQRRTPFLTTHFFHVNFFWFCISCWHWC